MTTGIVGLPVVPNARQVLMAVYKRTLEELAKIPETATYRKGTENITKHRLDIVEKNENSATIEKIIGVGQIEEVLEMAEREMALVETMKKYKPWESLVEEPLQEQWKWP